MVEPGTGEVRALPSRARWAANKKKGETYLNYVVPKEYGDANGFQAGSTFKAFVLSRRDHPGHPAVHPDQLAADDLDPGEPLPRPATATSAAPTCGAPRTRPASAPSTSTRAPSCR